MFEILGHLQRGLGQDTYNGYITRVFMVQYEKKIISGYPSHLEIGPFFAQENRT